jgi:hypothetical protein
MIAGWVTFVREGSGWRIPRVVEVPRVSVNDNGQAASAFYLQYVTHLEEIIDASTSGEVEDEFTR